MRFIEVYLGIKNYLKNNTLFISLRDMKERGYFGIGIYNPKTKHNLGTLWRSAYQMGASFIFLIKSRYKVQCSDTYKAYRHIPLFQFKDWKAFKTSRVYDCPVVAVEMGGDDIRTFSHPERCIYLLGAEDVGLPPKIVKECNKCIELPSLRRQSFNVSVSGSIVMYDRLIK